MDLNKIYDELLSYGKNSFGDAVKIRSGLFSESDLINVFSGGNELFFQLDKKGILDIMNIIIPKLSQLPSKDSFNHMIDILNLIQNEINNYYGKSKGDSRLSFYMNNGSKTDDEDVRICSMSQIKDLGLAKCAEKASLANNILLMLNNMGLFEYKVNYLNAITTLNNRSPEGHAFLEFNRINSKGEKIHIIYDVANPEIIISNGEEYSYPAIYSLTEDEYKLFLNGKKFDNSKFVMNNYYQLKEKREYSGFKMDLLIDETIDKQPYHKKLTNDKIINITGEGGSGKSTFSDKYRLDDNYIVVDYDLLVLNPNANTIEHELKEFLINKYGKSIFESINTVGLEKVQENFTTIYSEVTSYLTAKNPDKTIILDGSQLRFISSPELIKGEFVVLRPSLQTCVNRSVERFIKKNPNSTSLEIDNYKEKRKNTLYNLYPILNQLISKIDKLKQQITNMDISNFDIEIIQKFLNENARNYLQIIENEYGQFMNQEQHELMQKLLVSDNVIVEENGDKLLENQKQCILNDSSLSEKEKNEEISKLTIPIAHGGKTLEDGKIHFYPFEYFKETNSTNLTASELKKKCDKVLIHELLHYFIAPEYMKVKDPNIRKINSYTTEGLVDMCARDLQQKYNLNSNYTSDYGSNVIFVREALNNINDSQKRMQIVFQCSMEEIYNKTSTENYDSKKEFIKAYNKNTAFDQMISNISNISPNSDSTERYLYNKSANCQNKKDAINAIAEETEIRYPELREQIYPHLDYCEAIENQKIKNKQGDVRKLVPQNSNASKGYISSIILAIVVILFSILISIFVLNL